MSLDKVKALLYTNCEADEMKLMKDEIYLMDFLKIITDNPNIDNKVFNSKSLGTDIKSNGLELNGEHIFAVFFSNGMIYEIGRGFRPYTDAKHILKTYNKLKTN